MLQRILVCSAVLAAFLAGDTVTMRDGRTVQGEYLGGDARRIRVAVGDRVETLNVAEVSEIKFGSPAPPSSAASASSSASASASKSAQAQRVEVLKPEPEILKPKPAAAASSATGVEVPAGTSVVIRMIDDVDSERDAVGQTFRASVDEAVVIGNDTVIPRGANVVAKLVADQQSGRLTGKTELTLDLVSVELNGKKVDILTQEVTQASESRTNRTAKVVGGTAALGAIIGAIAGGGKGAAIGGVSGAAAGGAVQVLTKGQRVRIPSETRLTFTLQQPLRP